MLRRFYADRGQVYGMEYDHASCLMTVLQTIHHGLCFVGRKSCAGALFAPFAFNRKVIIAEVVFWQIGERREIGIFDILCFACRDAGVSHINVASLWPKNCGERFYALRGLKKVETHFLGRTDLQKVTPALSRNNVTHGPVRNSGLAH